ncbi:MAG TPA: dihydrolipoamide acetyltransferase family protein, partial [Caldimonas sp.]|nr:dihydrolipoamide acetyltransferase family protein [Caldimonas sp.]
MSLHVIKVPDIGEGIAEVELVAWRVKAGDDIADDQILADVMTDKATVEIPSPVAGRVLSLGGEVGQMLAVGADLIRIDAVADTGALRPSAAVMNTGTNATQPAAAAATTVSPAATVAPSAGARLSVQSTPSPTLATPGTPPPSTPAPGTPASSVSSAAAPHRFVPPPSPASTPSPAESLSASSHDGARPIASPALRARAWERGIDLRDVVPSGPGGRVMQRDLDAYGGPTRVPHLASASASVGAAAPSIGAATALASAASRHFGAGREPLAEGQPASATHAEKIVGLRRKIAQKMQEAKRRIPHFSYVEEIDVGEIEALREQLNAERGSSRGHLTLLPFLVRAIVLAAREVPQVNALFDDEAGVVTRHDAVHLGIATQTENGLMVPVLRHAEARDLWDNAAEIARLAGAARSGKIVRDELAGSTLTLTSLGRLGGIVST